LLIYMCTHMCVPCADAYIYIYIYISRLLEWFLGPPRAVKTPQIDEFCVPEK
jgi:hypothetical protein